MDFSDRMEWLFLGCLIGFVVGYIVRSLREIKATVDEVDDIVKQNKDEHGALSWKTASNLSLFLVVALTVWAAFVSQKASNDVEESYQRDTIARCESSQDVRVVQRATVDAIYTLATGSIQRDANSPPLTDKEVVLYNAYIDRVNKFREDMYKKIKPSELCAPYVNDNAVKPPTPPYPHVDNKETNDE